MHWKSKMENIKVVSLNARGLRNGLKRRKVFRFIKKNKANVGFLQETHGSKDKEHLWQAEFGHKIIYANGDSNARGVAICLDKSMSNACEEIIRDIQGRFIICKIKIKEYYYCFANVYAPNTDDTQVLEEMFNEVRKLDCIFSVIGGDFNVIRECRDRSSKVVYHPKCKTVIDDYCDNDKYVDIWREQHPNDCKFTWMAHKNVPTWSRIDYFLVSQSLRNQCVNSEILPSICSDHSLISMEFTSSENVRGPGSWKFNDEFLKNENFVIELRSFIKGFQRCYGYMNAIEKWELLKFEIAQFCRDYAKNRAAERNDRIFELYQKLSRMQEELLRPQGWTSDLLRSLNMVKEETNAYEEEDAKRAAFRCKMQWNQGGEKMSAYYFNLEKRNYVSKTMYVTRRSDGTLTKDYREILQIQHGFYSKLYTSDESVRFDMINNSNNKLSEMEKIAFDQCITKAELYDAMMTLKRGRTPGCDGLSIALYYTCWKELVDPLHEMYMVAWERGFLNPSGKRGTITLIPKKGRDETWISQWRPITLLCNDFKIWAKAIANRLDGATWLINKHQTGFVRNRTIFANLRKTMEIVTHLKKTNKPGAIVTVDFEKCFDRIEYQSIKGALKYLGFGDTFISMVFLLFNKLEMCTTNNGYVSDFFYKTRGVNQGCPASPLIFSFCGELMSRLIMENAHIKGISVHNIENILSQFADDTAAFLEYNEIVINEFSNVLAKVERQMGLKVSYEKTTVYRVGSICDSNAQYYTQKNLKWSNDDIELLGMSIPCNGEEGEVNWDYVVNKVRKTCNNWWNRNATLMGKILIVNALMGSLFVYKMTTMCDLSKDRIVFIEKILREFIWGGKKPKISFEMLKKDKCDGGLRLVDLSAKQKAIKVSWIFKDLDPFLSMCLYEALDQKLGELIWRCNLDPKDATKVFSEKNFWVDILKAWCELNFKKEVTQGEIENQIIWLNSHIKREGKPFVWHHWIEKGIFIMGDLVHENGSKKSAEELNVNWLELRSLWECIPAEWVEERNTPIIRKTEKTLYEQLLQCKTVSRHVYKKFIKDPTAILKYKDRWGNEEGICFAEEEYRKAFVAMYAITHVTKLRNFQYKLLLHKIVTNKTLFEWQLRDSPKCDFCEEIETTKHMLFECEHVKRVWNQLEEFFKNVRVVVEVNFMNVVLNTVHEQSKHIANLTVLILKQLIYRKKCQMVKINFEQFVAELELQHNIEFANARVKKQVFKHIKKWDPIVEFSSENAPALDS